MEQLEEIPDDAVEALLNEDWSNAYQILRQLANTGHPKAAHFIGWFYEQGIEVAQSDKDAFEWWSISAGHGVAESQSGLAQLYENGRGINQDYIMAYIWYSRAIMSGDAESQILLSNLSSQMTDAQLIEARSKLREQT